MEIDLPEVVAEVRKAFDAYEDALVNNKVDMLNALFRDDRRTIRYGVNEVLYHHLRPRLRHRLDALRAAIGGRQSRPADADLGEISRGLARRRRPRQPDGPAEIDLPTGIKNAAARKPRRLAFTVVTYSIETPLALIGASHFLISSAVNLPR